VKKSAFLILLVVCVMSSSVLLADKPAPAQGTSKFDVAAATQAYLAKMPTDQRARSDAYFEGGYWLQLWDFLLGAAIAVLLLAARWSARMRDLAVRLTRRKPLQSALYWVQYLVVVSVLTFPLNVYQGFFREHRYGLATQTLPAWLGDQGIGLGVGLVLGAMFIPLLYGIIRRLPRSWPVWGAVATVVFLAFVMVIQPVYIDPLFNKYTSLSDPTVRDPILRLARANGIAVSNVYKFDASRQTTRISANVAGFMGTQSIRLNDNLLNRCTLPEIEAVMAHEMGHYVLNHVYKMMFYFGVVIVVGFALLKWSFNAVIRRWGSSWGVEGPGDIAGLPLFVLLLSIFFFVLTPLNNTVSRTIEMEADMFGLNAARQPDGFAEVSLKLADYRKISPGPIEEFIFYDHPSGRVRIETAMRWKAENLPGHGQ
jgi:STE24 endopeptidase